MSAVEQVTALRDGIRPRQHFRQSVDRRRPRRLADLSNRRRLLGPSARRRRSANHRQRFRFVYRAVRLWQNHPDASSLPIWSGRPRVPLHNGVSPEQAPAAAPVRLHFSGACALPVANNRAQRCMLPLEIMGFDAHERRARMERYLKLVNLSGFERKFPWQLSGGMQQRASIARALSVRSGAVVHGQPFGALAGERRHAADKVTIQLKWVTQAQFAGYYVATAKGYYKDAGLDVTINPGGPDVAPPQVIAGGGADVVVDWMPSALASREKGVPLVNISQTFKKSGPGADLPRRHRHQDAGGFQGQDPRRVVRRQRISVPVVDGEAQAKDRRLARRRQGDQAGLQRRPAVAEAGRLHLDHDLQRILAGDRRRLQAEPARRLQVQRRRRRHAGRRSLCAWKPS